MDKQTFISKLSRGLRGLNHDDMVDALQYYSEMIDDMVEGGMSEADAVASLGDIARLRAYIVADCVQNRKKESAKSPIKSFFTVLAVCTSPVLIALAVVAVVVFLSVFISLAATSISLIAGGGYALVTSFVNSLEVGASSGGAAGAASFFGLMFAAALLIFLGVMTAKLAVIVARGTVRLFARVVLKRHKIEQNRTAQGRVRG